MRHKTPQEIDANNLDAKLAVAKEKLQVPEGPADRPAQHVEANTAVTHSDAAQLRRNAAGRILQQRARQRRDVDALG